MCILKICDPFLEYRLGIGSSITFGKYYKKEEAVLDDAAPIYWML